MEIHKQVEIDLAEKNKKLQEELKKYKNEENKEINISEENTINIINSNHESFIVNVDKFNLS